MADIKRLHRIIQEMGSDPNVSAHELVREVLKRDHDYNDYYLDNISKPVTESELEMMQQRKKDASGEIKEVQARLDEYLKEYGQHQQKIIPDQETTTLETIEQLRSDVKKRQDGFN
mgnify:FL=1